MYCGMALVSMLARLVTSMSEWSSTEERVVSYSRLCPLKVELSQDVRKRPWL
jgi:hypothetical protein